MKENTAALTCCAVDILSGPSTPSTRVSLAEATPGTEKGGLASESKANGKVQHHRAEDFSSAPMRMLYRLYYLLCVLSAAGLTACVFVSIVRPWWRGTATIPMYPSSSLLESTPSYIAKAALIFGSNLVSGTFFSALILVMGLLCDIFEETTDSTLNHLSTSTLTNVFGRPWCLIFRTEVLFLTYQVLQSVLVDSCALGSAPSFPGAPLRFPPTYLPPPPNVSETQPFYLCNCSTFIQLMTATWCLVVLEIAAAVSLLLLRVKETILGRMRTSR